MEIEDYCAKVRLHIDTINRTPFELPYGNNGKKIYANIFLDDRAGLDEAIDILESTMYRIRGDMAKQLTNGEEV